MTPEQFFLKNLELIESIARRVARRHHLGKEETRDFVAEIELRFVKDGYESLYDYWDCRRSVLRSYLIAVIEEWAAVLPAPVPVERQLSDMTKSFGPAAEMFVTLRVRDGLTFCEAAAFVRHQFPISEDELDRLDVLFPVRPPRRFVGEDRLLEVAAPEGEADRGLLRQELGAAQRKILAALQQALKKLPEGDRRLVLLERELSLGQIGRALKLGPTLLFHRLASLHGNLQQALARAGVRPQDVREAFDRSRLVPAPPLASWSATASVNARDGQEKGSPLPRS